MKEIKDLLKAARHAIDGGMNCHTPTYAAMDDLERAVDRLADKVSAIGKDRTDKINAVIEAAKDVVAWDWSENDADCVNDMQVLKDALNKLDQ